MFKNNTSDNKVMIQKNGIATNEKNSYSLSQLEGETLLKDQRDLFYFGRKATRVDEFNVALQNISSCVIH